MDRTGKPGRVGSPGQITMISCALVDRLDWKMVEKWSKCHNCLRGKSSKMGHVFHNYVKKLEGIISSLHPLLGSGRTWKDVWLSSAPSGMRLIWQNLNTFNSQNMDFHELLVLWHPILSDRWNVETHVSCHPAILDTRNEDIHAKPPFWPSNCFFLIRSRHAVDGRNPAPVSRWFIHVYPIAIPLFTVFYSCQ